jgi:hypothetical protein
MFTTEEQTEERVDAYVAALEAEKEGYAARKKQASVAKNDDVVALMGERIKAVDAELARFKESKKKDGAASE